MQNKTLNQQLIPDGELQDLSDDGHNPYLEFDSSFYFAPTDYFDIDLNEIINFLQQYGQVTTQNVERYYPQIATLILQKNAQRHPVRICYYCHTNPSAEVSRKEENDRLFSELIQRLIRNTLQQNGISSVSVHPIILPEDLAPNNPTNPISSNVSTPVNPTTSNPTQSNSSTQAFLQNSPKKEKKEFGSEFPKINFKSFIQIIMDANSRENPWDKLMLFGSAIIFYHKVNVKGFRRAFKSCKYVIKPENVRVKPSKEPILFQSYIKDNVPRAAGYGTLQIKAWSENKLGFYDPNERTCTNSNLIRNYEILGSARSRCGCITKSIFLRKWEIVLYIIGVILVIVAESLCAAFPDDQFLIRTLIYITYPLGIVFGAWFTTSIMACTSTYPPEVEFQIDSKIKDHLSRTHSEIVSCIPNGLQEFGISSTSKAGKFLLKNLANPAHEALKKVLKNDQILNPEFLRNLTVPQFEAIFAVYRTTDTNSGLFTDELQGKLATFIGTAFLCAKPEVAVYILQFMSWTNSSMLNWGMALYPEELNLVIALLKDFYLENRSRISTMNQETKYKMVIIAKITGV